MELFPFLRMLKLSLLFLFLPDAIKRGMRPMAEGIPTPAKTAPGTAPPKPEFLPLPAMNPVPGI